MNDEQQQAYDWAKNQNYQSVAARYARTLTTAADDLQSRLAESQRREQAAVEDLRVASIEGDMECNYCTGKRIAERCNGCRDGSRWQWRGQQDGKGEAE